MMVAKGIVDEARELVREGIGEPGDIDACLTGDVDSYITSLDSIIAQKDAAFERNRQELERQLKEAERTR